MRMSSACVDNALYLIIINVKLIQKFNKDGNNKTILDDPINIEKLVKYVLPIIERNEGWGSGDLTTKMFLDDPKKYQGEVDGTVWKNVHILMEGGEPIGLLEFSRTTIDDTKKERHKILNELLAGESLNEFNKLIGSDIEPTMLPQIREFLLSKPIYTAVGVVLKPSLQNKKTGYAENTL